MLKRLCPFDSSIYVTCTVARLLTCLEIDRRPSEGGGEGGLRAQGRERTEPGLEGHTPYRGCGGVLGSH